MSGHIHISKFYCIKTIIVIVFFFSFIQLPAQFYNGSQLSFGKNRVQYNQRFWSFYKFSNFDTYFYLGGKELAIYTAKFAEKKIGEIEKKLDYSLNGRIQFIVFNKLSDLKESNIGLINDEQYNTGGVTHIVGSKVILYFDGSHENLEEQISSGITHVILNQLLYGESISAMVKNSTLLSLPDWYIQGFVSYISDEWNTEIDNRVKDGILSGRYEKFNQLEGMEAVYAGHSIWRFIAEKYGTSVIPNIIYMAKVSRSVESGFLFVLGISFKSLIQDWLNYYDKEYYQITDRQFNPTIRPMLAKSGLNNVYNHIRISPDSKLVAYTSNQLGKYKVWLHNTETKKRKRIMKSGFKLDENTDYSYPLLAWHPSGQLLSVIFEHKGKILMYYYVIETGKFEKLRLFHFEKILDFAYSDNGQLLVFSAVQNGQSDIFVYNLAAHTYEPITKDVYDDLHPRFIHNSKDIIFSSNRVNDTLRFDDVNNPANIKLTSGNKDLFLYDYAKRSNVLKRITNTPLANETNPTEYNDRYISYLSDKNGINNRYLARFDSVISYIDTTTHYRHFTTIVPVTNYSHCIMEQDFSTKTNKYTEIIYNDGAYKIYVDDINKDISSVVEPENTHYISKLMKSSLESTLKTKWDTIKLQAVYPSNPTNIQFSINGMPISGPIYTKKAKMDTIYKKLPEAIKEETISADTNNVDINDYTFGKQIIYKPRDAEKTTVTSDSVSTTKTEVTIKEATTEKEYDDIFILPKQQNADVEYSVNELVNQANFSFLNATYQNFTARSADDSSAIYINSGFNALFKVGVTDLFEDYRIVGGIRFAFSQHNNEYFLSYSNLKRRIDKQIIFHRQSFQNAQVYSIVRYHSHGLYYIWKFPFNEVISIKGTAFLRNERGVFLATDMYNLKEPNMYRNWAGAKLEYTFDNTRAKGLNLYYGTRYKIFAEHFEMVDKRGNDLNVLGFDFRHYHKIHKTFIWANRFATSTSFGNNKLIYYMGGVDNWILPRPKFNPTINIDYDQHYAYQTLATNMRGFIQNIRNGNSFAVINSELRFPLFKYFSSRPIKSDFLENMQLMAFGDIGTAWTGSNPYSEENSLYTQVIQQGPIKITIRNQKEPIVGGYGFGLRSRLLGYFLRADWAWGVEDGVVNPAVFYLSMSLDF